ncbi:MAG TPA: hypothetical protein VH413_03510 [Verrucomicrobiae bacterium]|jgi:hypothetical protein|nr:hypothetical protein [Verrucomicrobiae bacterium]
MTLNWNKQKTQETERWQSEKEGQLLARKYLAETSRQITEIQMRHHHNFCYRYDSILTGMAQLNLLKPVKFLKKERATQRSGCDDKKDIVQYITLSPQIGEF